MKEKIRHLLAEKIIQKGQVKMYLRKLSECDGHTDEELNLLNDRKTDGKGSSGAGIV